MCWRVVIRRPNWVLGGHLGDDLNDGRGGIRWIGHENQGWLGFVLLGDYLVGLYWVNWRAEIFAVLTKTNECIAELAVERSLIPAKKLNAFDVERVGWLGGIWRDGRVGGEWARIGFSGEALPGEDEVEVGIVLFKRVEFVHFLLLNGELEREVGGFDGDEAGLAPADGGDLVDEVAFGVVGGAIAFVDSGEVSVPGVGIFGCDEDVDFGGEAVFEGVFGRYRAAFGGGWAF